MTPNLAGALLMALGMAVFAANDAMGKWLVADYGVAQVVLLRSLAAVLFLTPFLLRGRSLAQRLRGAPRPGLQLLRAVLTTAEVFLFYLAVAALPLADVMAFWMAAPIYVVAVSPLILGERVSLRIWAAVAVGFVGVLFLLAPSLRIFEAGAIFAVLGTVAFAGMMLLGRFLRATPDRDLVLFQTGAALVAGLVLAPFDWQPIRSGLDLGLLALLGIVAMSAHLLITRALKLADAAVVAPLQYSLLAWGMLFGFLFFDDVPTRAMLIGAALIVGSGLIVMRRSDKMEDVG